MKKIKYSLILVFVLGLFVYLPNVKANTCSAKGVNTCNSTEYTAKDGTKKKCVWRTKVASQNAGYCTTQEEDKCEVGSRHCDCFDSNTCPSSDDFGNACHKYPTAGCVAETEYQASQTRYDDDDTPSFLEDEGTTSCGKIKNIPKYIPFITSLTVTILTIISMGMLVIMGTIDLFKGIVSGRDDDIKKNQKAFVGRLTSALIIFLLVALTKLFISLISNAMGTTNGIVSCIDLFINNR